MATAQTQITLPLGYEDAKPVGGESTSANGPTEQFQLPKGWEDAKPVVSPRLSGQDVIKAAPSTWESFKSAVEHPINYLGEVEQDVTEGGGRTVVGRGLGHMQHGSLDDLGYNADHTPVASVMAGPIQGPPKLVRGVLRMIAPPDNDKTLAEEAKERVGGLNELVSGAVQTPGPLIALSPTSLPRIVAATGASKAVSKGLGYIGLPEEYRELGANIAGGIAAGAPELTERFSATPSKSPLGRIQSPGEQLEREYEARAINPKQTTTTAETTPVPSLDRLVEAVTKPLERPPIKPGVPLREQATASAEPKAPRTQFEAVHGKDLEQAISKEFPDESKASTVRERLHSLKNAELGNLAVKEGVIESGTPISRAKTSGGITRAEAFNKLLDKVGSVTNILRALGEREEGEAGLPQTIGDPFVTERYVEPSVHGAEADRAAAAYLRRQRVTQLPRIKLVGDEPSTSETNVSSLADSFLKKQSAKPAVLLPETTDGELSPQEVQGIAERYLRELWGRTEGELGKPGSVGEPFEPEPAWIDKLTRAERYRLGDASHKYEVETDPELKAEAGEEFQKLYDELKKRVAKETSDDASPFERFSGPKGEKAPKRIINPPNPSRLEGRTKAQQQKYLNKIKSYPKVEKVPQSLGASETPELQRAGVPIRIEQSPRRVALDRLKKAQEAMLKRNRKK